VTQFGTNDNNSNANYISNAKVTYADSKWSSATTYYWPSAATLSFYAYAPYDDNASATITSEAKTLPFSVQDSPYSQVDLLWATPVTGKTKPTSTESAKVDFVFGHALSRIGVSVATGSEFQSSLTVKVTKVEIIGKFNTSGTLDISKALTETSGNWSSVTTSSSDVTYTIDPTDFSITGASASAKDIEDYVMTIPSATAVDGFKINLYYDVYSSGLVIGSKKMASYPASTATVTSTFEIGKAYTYKFTFGKLQNSSTDNSDKTFSEIEFDVSTDVTAWSVQNATDALTVTNTEAAPSGS
jgi:hypothetical protein